MPSLNKNNKSIVLKKLKTIYNHVQNSKDKNVVTIAANQDQDHVSHIEVEAVEHVRTNSITAQMIEGHTRGNTLSVYIEKEGEGETGNDSDDKSESESESESENQNESEMTMVWNNGVKQWG